MSANQIENQIAANQKESMQILSQLSQTGLSIPQHQALSNRLDMLNRSRTYWANEYFRITGKRLFPAPQTAIKTAPLSVPPSTPVQQTESAPTMEQWKQMRLKIKLSLLGSPQFIRVENYLGLLEKNAGSGVPKIPETVGFGKFQQRGINGDLTVKFYNGTPIGQTKKPYFTENGEAVVLFTDGSIVKIGEEGLLIFYGDSSHLIKKVPNVEINRPELLKALKALRGE